jgi:hypothetical protein
MKLLKNYSKNIGYRSAFEGLNGTMKAYIYFRSSYWNSFVWQYCEGHFVTIQDFDKQLIAVGKLPIYLEKI